MRKLDKLVMVQSLLGLVVAGAIGCGDDGKKQTKLDGSMDLAADAPDAAQPDVAPPLDTAKLDVPSSPDVGQGETGASIDGMGAVDAGAMTMASITFRLDNLGTQTVYLFSACWVPLTVTSTADGTEYTNAQYCACNCADSSCMESVKCGPCAPPSGVAVAAGQTSDLSWKAGKFTLETKTGTAGSFQCLGHAPIATGDYRVAVTVYPTEADARAQTNGRTVQQSLVLGTTNATVVVPIQ